MNEERIYYVGQKDPKRDTIAGTNAIWRGGLGSRRFVPPAAAEKLCDFPDVWVDEKTFMAQYPDVYAELYGEQTGPASETLSQASVASIPVVDQDDLKPTAEPVNTTAGEADGKTAENTDRTVLIQEAIRKLDRTNTEHFTGSGVPKVAAVRTAMNDQSVSAQELNEAFAGIKEDFRQ